MYAQTHNGTDVFKGTAILYDFLSRKNNTTPFFSCRFDVFTRCYDAAWKLALARELIGVRFYGPGNKECSGTENQQRVAELENQKFPSHHTVYDGFVLKYTNTAIFSLTPFLLPRTF